MLFGKCAVVALDEESAEARDVFIFVAARVDDEVNAARFILLAQGRLCLCVMRERVARRLERSRAVV